MKEEIELLTVSNNKIGTMIDYFKNYLAEENYSADKKKSMEDITDKNDKEFKCEECNFVGNSNVSLKKQINAKHAPLPMDYNNKESHPLSEDVQDLFKIEVLEGEEVFACNVCSYTNQQRY